MSRHAFGRVAVALLIAGACQPTVSPMPSMSTADLAACQGIPAPPPSPPDFGPDDAYLDRIYEPLTAEITGRMPEFNSIFMDKVHHIIVIGARHPTKAMCDDLHARYGPWIRVEQSEGVELQ